MEPRVIFASHDRRRPGRSFAFDGPVGELRATAVEEVAGILAAAEAAAAKGLFAAGFVCYEASPGFDPCLRVRPRRAGETLPLAWFGIFERRVDFPAAQFPSVPPRLDWRADTDEVSFARAIAAIRGRIAAGDTYQVNYTFRLRAPFSGDARGLWQALAPAQGAGYGAFIDIGGHAIISLSPELFFQRQGKRVITRPMKGTRPRGRFSAEDSALAGELRSSEKDRAENLMIVDLLRNDLGRLAEYGSVQVPELFSVERYETVLQMTSTVEARLRSGVNLVDLFAALFPCGSVTGAPKISTMGIIADLETSTRGVYCGAIGYLGPDGEAAFNVPIRTIVVDRNRSLAEYGVGGGITWDSTPADEYRECAAKAQVLSNPWRPFRLLETIRFETGRGFHLLDRHLARLVDSAGHFAFSCDGDQVRDRLERHALSLTRAGVHKVRLLLAPDGGLEVESEPIADDVATPVPLRICHELPVDSSERLLFHKTTEREVYDRRMKFAPPGGQVVLVNEGGRVTESATANLVVLLDGDLFTPPLEDGLLPGVQREQELATGRVRERSLGPDDLRRAQDIWLINSVRGWRRALLVDG